MISEHISYREATRSITALRNGYKNDPSEYQLRNMIALAENHFEPLRTALGGKPIGIASFFRSKELNDAIGGAINSQHMAMKSRGAAYDLDADIYDVPGVTNADIFYWTLEYGEFDQLIWEYGTSDNPEWVHVSFNPIKNRKQALICRRSYPKYLKFNETNLLLLC